MSPVHKPILGISLGTRLLGLAVIKDDKLLYWRVRKFNRAWSPQQLERVMSFITRYAQLYEVTAIAVKVPTKGRLSKGIIELVARISTYASDHNLELKPFGISELKKFLSKTSLNRNEMMRLVCVRFPYLECKYQRELSNRKEYHVKMFEAIVAGLCMELIVHKRKR